MKSNVTNKGETGKWSDKEERMVERKEHRNKREEQQGKGRKKEKVEIKEKQNERQDKIRLNNVNYKYDIISPVTIYYPNLKYTKFNNTRQQNIQFDKISVATKW